MEIDCIGPERVVKSSTAESPLHSKAWAHGKGPGAVIKLLGF